MKYIAAYALVVLGGNATPSEDDVKKVLEAAGGEVNTEEVAKTVSALKGKQLHEVIANGTAKMATMSFGAAPSGGAAAKTEAKQEAKKEEKPVEEAEEVDLGGGGLFGDDEEW